MYNFLFLFTVDICQNILISPHKNYAKSLLRVKQEVLVLKGPGLANLAFSCPSSNIKN